MDDGIGRSGVRLMALFFFAVNALGVLVFWNSETDVLKWTAVAVILGASLFLLTLVVALTSKKPVSAAAPVVMEQVSEPVRTVALPVPKPAPVAPPAPPQSPPVAARQSMNWEPAEEPDARAHLRERYTQNTQLVKDILNPYAPVEHVPRVVAQRWTPRMGDATPVGTTRGRCSQCQSIVVAPTARPLDLACPVCENVTRLKA
jgi:hypothetical protein